MHVQHRRRALTCLAVTASLTLPTGMLAMTGPTGYAVPSESKSGASQQQAGRLMENLDRGVVAVRSSETEVFVSWRLLGLDPEGIGFNVYRSTGGGEYEKLNAEVLTGGTNFVDSSADLSQDNSYQVRPVIDGAEQPASKPFTLSADHAEEPVVRMPLRDGGAVKFVWVGDLNGDGDYDYVLDRQEPQQRLEAYESDGTFLWEVNMGPNSENQDNIEGGSSSINLGHNDGVTVQDFDSDGRAEVAVRVANGVTFGDGSTHTEDDDTRQSVAILDGETGAPRATAPIPDDFIEDGPMMARFGVGYLDGQHPSLVAFLKNRKDDGAFNLIMGAWRFDGQQLTQQWQWVREDPAHADGHNTRSIDVDGDGKDEVAEIGFVLNGDGSLRYSLADAGVVHGDRFHITDMDPSHPGLEGYGVQQDNPNGLREYYYDAATGEMIWQHTAEGTADVGRGMAGDVDPNFPGMEVWSFDGLYNAPSNELTQEDTSLSPWPQLGLHWDGDKTTELLNDGKFEEWDPENPTDSSELPQILGIGDYGAVNASQEVQPTMVGDILGDWREEAVYTNDSFNELIIFTTNQPTDTRLYTLAHNPAYRNAMTFKGYMQPHYPDYFIGAGMQQPARPNIRYAGK